MNAIPPNIEPKTIRARLKGIEINYYLAHVSNEQLWLYAATGNFESRPQIAREFAVVQNEFRTHCPFQNDRDAVMGECRYRLRAWLRKLCG